MKSLLFSLCLYLVFAKVYAQPIVLSSPDTGYPVAGRCEVLDTQAGDISVDSLLKHPERYRFVAVKNQRAERSAGQKRWFRFTVQTPLYTPFYLYAESDLSSPATLYQTHGNRIQDTFSFVKGQNNTAISVPQARSRRLTPLRLKPGNPYTFYWHSAEIPETLTLVSGERLLSVFLRQDSFDGFYYGFVLIIIVYNILLYIRLKDRDHLTYAIWMGIQCLVYSITFAHLRNWLPTVYYSFFLKHFLAVTFLAAAFHILFGITFLQLRQHARRLYQTGLVLFYLCVFLSFIVVIAGVFSIYLPYNAAFLTGLIDLVFTLICGVAALRKGFKPAWYYVLGLLLIYGGTVVYVFTSLKLMPSTFWTTNGLLLGSTLEILLFTLALAYKVNLLKQQKEDAIQDQLRLLEQNQTLIETQNRVLEEKVEQRTAELKASQAQLIQKEKLASLGELTAGIAHEIQNPLNFVNNFAEVSAELTGELKDELTRGDLDEAGFIADDLAQNLTKIAHHGRRASAIVRGMLEHSRMESGDRQATNLSTLADDYLRLAYQGQRAKDNTFNCRLITAFDPALPPVNVVAQDIGRVLLNLCQNAFYAVQQRATQAGEGYEPTVWVSTRRQNDHIELRVQDNGTGIPDAIRTKIFQPFFTTKPAGEGTGLGLSLSYDIITKGHGGTMTVESQQGEGTAFIIQLPIS